MKEVDVRELQFNPFEMIGGQWWLVTAGNKERGWNTMTASWGHLGAIWGQNHGMPTAVIYIRPQRYTKEFVDREEIFTLSVLPEKYRRALALLGTKSGRDGDKVAEAGLTPVFDGDATYFAEAERVFVCRKVYHAPILAEGFTDQSIIEDHYPQRDFHEMYIGEIVRTLEK